MRRRVNEIEWKKLQTRKGCRPPGGRKRHNKWRSSIFGSDVAARALPPLTREQNTLGFWKNRPSLRVVGPGELKMTPTRTVVVPGCSVLVDTHDKLHLEREGIGTCLCWEHLQNIPGRHRNNFPCCVSPPPCCFR